MIKLKDCHKKFKGCFIGLIAMTSSSCMAQAVGNNNWKIRASAFGLGIGFGYGIGDKSGKAVLGFGVAKLGWDLQKGYKPDPVTAMYGGFLGMTVRQWRKEKPKQQKNDKRRTKKVRE